MLNFSSHLQWFQAKIGSYDKQIWETSVEQRILQGLENRPKKDGSLHKELIDIDLVRGSTFSKAKPRHGLKSVIFNGLKRVIFFPYFFSQWRDHFNKELVYCFMFHYIIQLIQLVLYFFWSNSSEVMLEEILLPVVLALSLGVLHAHIIAPYTVKKRRKKTVSASAPISKQHGVTSQLSNTSQQSSKENFKTDSNPTSSVATAVNRLKKNVAFTKPDSNHSDLSADDGPIDLGQTTVHTEGYDGETETKDSSSSEADSETPGTKGADLIAGGGGATKHGEVLSEMVSLDQGQAKSTSKRVKISDGCERTAAYSKMKPPIRKCSQSETITVTDEEDLKKFISAKNKHIPDPTPITCTKKEKDKGHWKQASAPGQGKPYKIARTRRPTSEYTGNQSGLSSDNTSTSNVVYHQPSTNTAIPDSGKTGGRCSFSESTILSALQATALMEPSAFINGNTTSPDTITDHSSDDRRHSTISAIETIDSKTAGLFTAEARTAVAEQMVSHSQPHTPINHAANRARLKIEVRKISSADASPTPSRKSSVVLPKPRDIVQRPTISQDQAKDNIDSGVRVVNTSISSEDISVKIIDLNEDTITKSHKKREEFKQLFEKKAQAIQIEKSASTTTSSRNSASDSKHGKVKQRRHRDEYKQCAPSSSGVSEAKGKSKRHKETVQSMSETEYDRMNSDVNSTGNSTSDAEDVCQGKGGAGDQTGEQLHKGQEYVEERQPCNIVKIGASSGGLPGKNENNAGAAEDIYRPLQSGDIFQPEMGPDDPFVMWYKEAHTPGMTGSVSCYIWENDELKKTNLSLLDIGWSIIQAVERHVQDKSYSPLGFFTIIMLCFTPVFFRIYVNREYLRSAVAMARHCELLVLLNSWLMIGTSGNSSMALSPHQHQFYSWTNDIVPLTITSVLASDWPVRLIIVLGVVLRLVLYTMTFLMLCVAENSFEQRLQYAKHFCRLTSSRRARKYYLPHFRLNKLANIKCWLSLRSYLKKRGPQRSVDSIISSAFYMLLTMLSLVCVNLLQSTDNLFINRLINWDMMLCSLALGVFMMRFLVLGTKITKKYRNLSVIITEQINLFLAMQTRPHKKEELTLAHSVLRLAESLLKEVEGPFRVCGWSMNPFLYNVLKVVILSVFSTVLSETLGFKMKLYKIRINPANW